MEIANIHAFAPSGEGQSDPILAVLLNAWNQWYKNPTEANSTVLLRILVLDGADIQAAAQGKSPPHGWPPNTTFNHYFTHAAFLLESWMDGGCQPSGIQQVSEFIGDVVEWISQPS